MVLINSQRKGASAEREVASLIFQNTGVRLKRNLERYICGSDESKGWYKTPSYLGAFLYKGFTGVRNLSSYKFFVGAIYKPVVCAVS